MPHEAPPEYHRIGGRGDQHGRHGRHQAPHGEEGGRTTERMANEGAHRSDDGAHRGKRGGELGEGGAGATGVPMTGSIECDDAEFFRQQLGHEQPEAAGTTAPSMHEQHDRPAAPTPPGKLQSVMRDTERFTGCEEDFLLRPQRMLWRAGEESLGDPRRARRGQGTEELEAETKPDDPRVNSTQRIRPGRLVGVAGAHPATGPRSMTTSTMTMTATMSMTMPARSICRTVTRPDP